MSQVIEQVKNVLTIEAEGILGLIDRIGPEFEKAVDIILNAKGRVILTGIGKSGLVGRKISATLNSTGTPSLFLHPAEAIHGDLGMVTPNDVILAISNSGNTKEINSILPILRDIGAKIISFTGNPRSLMAELSNVVIDVGVEREACPLGLAPTTSTTAALAMGDALAVVLINMRKFSKKDFRRFHPGGTLGERLKVRVKEVMITGDNIPAVKIDTPMQDVIKEMDSKGIGATLVIDDEERLLGIITDGDLRRALLKTENIKGLRCQDVMSIAPKTIDEDQLAAEALALMELNQIMHLVIIDRTRKVKGILHLHDLLGREEFKLNDEFRPTPRINS